MKGGRTSPYHLDDLMQKIVSLAKRRGFVFPSSEIYGGFSSSYDFGPLGAEMKNNIKNAWRYEMLMSQENIVSEKGVRSALGREKRPVVAVSFRLAGRKVKTVATISDRSDLKRPMIVGRRDLGGFLVRGGEK